MTLFFTDALNLVIKNKDAELEKWERSGSHATVVEFDSALLQLPDHMETKIPLDADHSQMVKFDNRHAFGYNSVLVKLNEFERAAPDVIRARFESQGHLLCIIHKSHT